jgi:hypothetical protein
MRSLWSFRARIVLVAGLVPLLFVVSFLPLSRMDFLARRDARSIIGRVGPSRRSLIALNQSHRKPDHHLLIDPVLVYSTFLGGDSIGTGTLLGPSGGRRWGDQRCRLSCDFGRRAAQQFPEEFCRFSF